MTYRKKKEKITVNFGFCVLFNNLECIIINGKTINFTEV